MNMNEKNWRVIVWFMKWVDLAESLVSILTFTYYMPPWGMLVRARKQLKIHDEIQKMDKIRKSM